MPSPSPKIKVEKARLRHRKPVTHWHAPTEQRRVVLLAERIHATNLHRRATIQGRRKQPLISDRVILFLCTGSFAIGMIAVISTVMFFAWVITNLNVASFEARVTFHQQKEVIPPKEMPEYCLLPRGVPQNEKVSIQMNTLDGFKDLREWTLEQLNIIGEKDNIQFQLSQNSALAIYFANSDSEIKAEDISFLVHAGFHFIHFLFLTYRCQRYCNCCCQRKISPRG